MTILVETQFSYDQSEDVAYGGNACDLYLGDDWF
jgi:hypothetical protein